ncbi:MAG: helix-turn-helix transcriptional regulator [Zoogloea sp.]|nr:helix-turn-helix transcriptional regulator [Zoogloea sp.]
MIRFRLAELIADAQFKTGRHITMKEIAEATGINRMTLSRMTNVRGYSTSTDTIDKLCGFFGCDVSDVARYIAEEAPSAAPEAAPAKKRAGRTSTAKQVASATKASPKTR